MALDMSGEVVLPASRAAVYAALNDPDVLKACIPGCESLEKVSDTELKASVQVKIGPVKARFKGTVTLSELVPPESYRIDGNGDGGISGFAKGGASVRLDEVPDGTRLSYRVEAHIGGKIAQLGQRLVAGTAKKLGDDFFQRLVASFAPAAEDACGASGG